MALTIERNKIRGRGYIPIFLLHVIPLLVLFAILLMLILGMGGLFTLPVYLRYYKSLIPFTVLIPILIALSTALSYRRVVVSITPLKSVNVEKLVEFFYRQDYIKDSKIAKTDSVNEKYIFKRERFMRRALCLNFDKPYIEITSSEVRVVMLKRLSVLLLTQFHYSKKYELVAHDSVENE